jgi:hypothetical protein
MEEKTAGWRKIEVAKFRLTVVVSLPFCIFTIITNFGTANLQAILVA